MQALQAAAGDGSHREGAVLDDAAHEGREEFAEDLSLVPAGRTRGTLEDRKSITLKRIRL